MGGASEPPAPVGDPPTGTRESNIVKGTFLLAGNIASIQSGESPDGTGRSPVLPKTEFSDTL